MRILAAATWFMLLVGAGCGDNRSATPLDALPDRIPSCGDAVVDPGEACDDGDTVPDAACSADCELTCGNGVVNTEFDERCDPGIASGPGACPTEASCNDGAACTADALDTSRGACVARCGHVDIDAPANNDGCCPAGGTPGNDNDCDGLCGNGVVDPGEACDTAIATGAGACPTSCADDDVACTAEHLSGAGSCDAACTFPEITEPANGDGCCPVGADATNDNDCQPPVVFRFSDLALRDPHVVADLGICADAGPLLVDAAITEAVRFDGDDADTLLDLSVVAVFRNFTQAPGTQPIEIHLASCSSPLAGTTCGPGALKIKTTATNLSAAECLTFFPGTVRPYEPPVTSTAAPCFVTEPIVLNVVLLGIPFNLRSVRLAGTYDGDPATTTSNGLLLGFLTEPVADVTMLPDTLPIVGGKPLSEVLPGGTNNCATYSDKDTENGASGWWFYLNFPAAQVSWTDSMAICGNGTTDIGEECDTAIPAGMPGACPTSCNDNVACTTDAVTGTACDAKCTFTRIIDNTDGCCPPGTGEGEDSDCTVAICGNGFPETGEDCDDGDTMLDPICTAACKNTCGNGTVDTGFPGFPPESDELCDLGIPSGQTGECPTAASCDDSESCTVDIVENEGTCAARCLNAPITAPQDGDGCCPTGADPTTDDDCPVMPVTIRQQLARLLFGNDGLISH